MEMDHKDQCWKTIIYETFIGGLLILLILIILASATLLASYFPANKTNGKILTSGEARKFLLYLPESYDPATPAPLVINLHGFFQWPPNQMRVSQWNELADQFGFIVVYPSGAGFPLRWRVVTDPAEPGGHGKEVTFISDLIDGLESEYNIDPARIYTSDLFNGGGMSVLLSYQLQVQ
jgi:polyhydroxybutyrate depolymerase